MTGTIRITLKSDLCAGSGESVGTTVNRDLCIRDSGFPYIPARRLKGCLLDAARWLEGYGAADSSVIAALFGTNTGVTGAIRIRDALFPGTEAMERWLVDVPEPLRWAAKPLNVAKLFTSVRGQTRLQDGVAKDKSLRYTRVLAHYNAMDGEQETALEASVTLTAPKGCTVSEEEMGALLGNCCLATRHIGSSRNRGLGYVKMEWIPDSCAHDEPDARKRLEIPPAGLVEIRYTLALDAPVSLPGSGTDDTKIPARSVIGCVSAAYRRMGNASDALFRELFLDGNITQWSALTPVVDGQRTVPAPLSLVKMKNQDRYRNLLTDSVGLEEKRSQLSDVYALPTDNGFLLTKPQSHTKYHHSHGDMGTLYMQDSLDAGMLYGGTVTLPSRLAAQVLELLQKTDFAFGRSRSAQYAACSLAGAPEVVPVYQRKVSLPTGGTLYAVLESDLVLVQNGVYVADNASVREALAERLGTNPAFPGETRDYCQYRIISGFQEQWHLQKPQIPAVAAGSVYCFRTDTAEFDCFQTQPDGQAEPRYITLGECQEGSFRGAFSGEGFGRVRIYTAREMAQRVVFKTCPPDTQTHDAADADAVEKLETALIVSAGLDALKQSVRSYYENLRKAYKERRREKGNWLTTGTIERLRLMLAKSENENYENFLKRIGTIKESDVHSQKTRSERDKALELVRGLCGEEHITVESMFFRTDDEVLLKMILARPAAKEQIEKYWFKAMRYLLYIAYYDRKAV